MSLRNQIKKLVKRSKEGSEQYRRDRSNILSECADEMHANGHHLQHPAGIKHKHILALVNGWMEKGIKIRTIDNRLIHLRWLCEKVGKANLMGRENEKYRGKLPPTFTRETPVGRALAPNWDKWGKLPEKKLKDRCAKASIALTWMAGARLKASIMGDPSRSENGLLILKHGEDKNGRPNTVDYREELEANPRLRDVETFVKKISAETGGRLIPPDKNYKKQKKHVEYLVRKFELGGCHARRTQYGQEYYNRQIAERAPALGLAPWVCPANGGPEKLDDPRAIELDKEVRMELAKHFGHGRIGVIRYYI